MSYATDGQLEPRIPEEINEHEYPDYMGYKIAVKVWSDGLYTLHIEKKTLYGYVDSIEDGEYDYEYMPFEDDVHEKIDEILEERFDRSIENQSP